MDEYIYNNTVSKQPTHFVMAVELIKNARQKHNIASENWAYPVLSFGDPKNDEYKYYAEVWVDGMDWNSTYWLLESASRESPKCYPMIRFSHNEERDKLNSRELEQIFTAIMWARRNHLWIKSGDPTGVYNDTVWPFLEFKIGVEDSLWINAFYSYVIQNRVKLFLINRHLIDFLDVKKDSVD